MDTQRIAARMQWQATMRTYPVLTESGVIWVKSPDSIRYNNAAVEVHNGHNWQPIREMTIAVWAQG